jgi:hypothetical protein
VVVPRRRELLFETLDSRVMAVSYIAKGDSFALTGKPWVWPEIHVRDTNIYSPTIWRRTASASRRCSRTMTRAVRRGPRT